MTEFETRTTLVPEDALYQLATEKDYPDAELLERVIMNYPDHAEALTRLAIEIALDRLNGDAPSSIESDEEDLSPAISRAMSRFENALYEEQSTKTPSAPVETKSMKRPAVPANPFSIISPKEFRAFSKRMGANTVFVAKLRDRQIDVSTMTPGFIAHAAEHLPAEQAVLIAHLSAPPTASAAGSFHKADDKPTSGGRQSLEHAIRSSLLSMEQQAILLRL